MKEATKIKVIILTIVMAILALALIGCNDDNLDSQGKDKVVTFSSWEIVKLPTMDEEGQLTRKGSDGKDYKFTLPKLTSKDYTKESITTSSCDIYGEDKYTICAEGDNYSFIVKTNKLAHDYGEVTYIFADDMSMGIAQRVCKNNKEHNEKILATIKSEVTKKATCEEKGETTYTAHFDKDWAVDQVVVLKDVDALGHDYGEVEYIWNDNMTKCMARQICKHDNEHIKQVESSSVVASVYATPTFKDKGKIRYSAEFSKGWDDYDLDEEIPTLGDKAYTLNETVSNSTAYIRGHGKYSITKNGTDFDFIGDLAFKDLYYFFNKNYKDSLTKSYLYYGYTQDEINNIILELETNDIKVYDNASLKKLVDNYNQANITPIKIAEGVKNQKYNEILYSTLSKTANKFQLTAFIKDSKLHLCDYSGIVITDNATKLQSEIESNLRKAGIYEKVIKIDNETLLLIDEATHNYTAFDMLENMLLDGNGDATTKDGRFLINVNHDANSYAIKDNVEYILSSALENNCNEVSIPASVKYIGSYGLAYIGKVNALANSNLEYIGDNAFVRSGDINLLNFPNLKVIQDKAFSNSSISRANVNNLEHIGTNAFENCASLVEVNIKNGDLKIESNAFTNLSSLRIVSLPKNINIKLNAFSGCNNISYYLKDATIPANYKDWNQSVDNRSYLYLYSEKSNNAPIEGVTGYWHYVDNDIERW